MPPARKRPAASDAGDAGASGVAGAGAPAAAAAAGDEAAAAKRRRPPGGLQAVLKPVADVGRASPQAAPAAEDKGAALRGVAEALMNGWDLWIAERPHCIVELEAYVHGPGHPDPYTHGDDGQNRCGVWYFHRKGGSFKSGTFKGLDLACGDGARDVVAGLLLRSVRTPEGDLVEGPCLVVDRILKLCGAASIAAFTAGRPAAELPAEATEGLQLRPAAAARSDRLWAAPRVGLVLRAEDKTHMGGGQPADFVCRPYRFSTAPWRLAKFRAGFAAAACLGLAPDALEELGRQLALGKVGEYAAVAERGRREGRPERFLDRKVATQGELCELFGACSARGRRR